MKILLISHSFPPTHSAESILVTKTIRGLSAFGNDIVVFTSTGSTTYGLDESLTEILPDNLRVIRTPARESRKLLRLLRLVAPFALYMPDPAIPWAFYSRKPLMDLVNRERFDLIFSWAQPFSSHLLGLHISKRIPVPWIAHFSDPLYDNPYYNQFPVNPHRRVNRRIEASIFQHADEIQFVSEEARTLAARRYPITVTGKFTTIPHCYDLSLYPKVTAPPGNPVNISYVGDFQSARNPRNLLEAILLLKQEMPTLSDSLRIRFIGRVRDKDLLRLKNLGLQDVVEAVGKVSYSDSLEYIVNSDILLLIDAEFPGYNVFFPSKLADYLGSGRPIIGITPAGSTSDRILREIGYPSISPTNLTGIKSVLKAALDGNFPAQLPPTKYSSRTVAQQLHARIEALVDKGHPKSSETCNKNSR